MAEHDDPISRVVAAYNQEMGVLPEDITPRMRAKQYDAMWKALHELRNLEPRLILWDAQLDQILAVK